MWFLSKNCRDIAERSSGSNIAWPFDEHKFNLAIVRSRKGPTQILLIESSARRNGGSRLSIATTITANIAPINISNLVVATVADYRIRSSGVRG